MLRRSWVWIVSAVLTGTALAAAVSLVQPPKYAATVKVFVSTSNEGSVSELQLGNTFTQQRVATYADLVTTPAVLDPVIQEVAPGEEVAELSENIRAQALTDTSLLEITVTDQDADRAAVIANAVSDSLTSVIEDIETTQGAETSPVRLSIVQHAEAPNTPVSPRLLVNLVLGMLVGLLTGSGLALFREVLDTRVRTERDIEALASVPVIGGIPFDADLKSHRLVIHTDPLSPHAEAFRSIRTNLQFLQADRQERIFVITSSVQGESKSTTAANLALALADTQQRVLLIDADLRRPKLAEYLGMEGSVGLTDLLIGRVEPPQVIQRWGDSQMYVLPAGQRPPNPSELLGSGVMKEALEEFGRVFDAVVIDSPPLLPVTDAAILSQHATGVIVAAAANHVKRTQIAAALQTLEQVHANIAGIVLTMLPAKGVDRVDRYAHAYAYENDDVRNPQRRSTAT
ncbi:polysaccharide biosynthesis tyrosine autokinase [Sediminivirga luteola]|uniref:non-specific protein-tyrosine kinase n=1 Tax=Sediminivirga luteola TaxID=1774748 RepID=A0A8J2TX26_9MICO|nr:chromosome partitioning protein [Sediminivirga luteola]